MKTESITSRQNPRIKQAVKLRERRQREQQGRFLIDGLRELRRAIAAGVLIEEFYYAPDICDPEQLALLRASLPNATLKFEITLEVHERLAYGERSEGVIAVAKIPQQDLTACQLVGLPLIVVLEGVEKPGNLGAVLRSADAVGVSALIVTGMGTDLYNPNVVRASLGTLFNVPVFTASSEDALAWLRQQNLAIFAARVDATENYATVSWNQPAAIVLGSEAAGLTERWHAEDITPIFLPMLGVADSLNVSATASVLCYEALRQRAAEQE